MLQEFEQFKKMVQDECEDKVRLRLLPSDMIPKLQPLNMSLNSNPVAKTKALFSSKSWSNYCRSDKFINEN
jgi:hypothetical protein